MDGPTRPARQGVQSPVRDYKIKENPGLVKNMMSLIKKNSVRQKTLKNAKKDRPTDRQTAGFSYVYATKHQAMIRLKSRLCASFL